MEDESPDEEIKLKELSDEKLEEKIEEMSDKELKKKIEQTSGDELEQRLLELARKGQYKPLIRWSLYALIAIALYFIFVPYETKLILFGTDHLIAAATVSFLVGVFPAVVNYGVGAGQSFSSTTHVLGGKEFLEIEFHERRRMWSGFALGIGPYIITTILIITHLIIY